MANTTRLQIVLATALFAFASLTATPVAAQTATGEAVSTRPSGVMGNKAPYRILMDHTSGDVRLESPGGETLDHWNRFDGDTPLTEIPPDRPVRVIITNSNPLLYNYKVRAEVIKQAELKACSDLGQRFFSQGMLLTSAAVGGGAILAGGFNLSSLSGGFLDMPGKVSRATPRTRGSATLTESALEQQMAAVRVEANGFADYANTLVNLSSSLQDSLRIFAAQAESVPLEGLLARFQGSLEKVQPGLSDPAKTPVLIGARTDQAAEALGTLNNIAGSITRGQYAGSSNDLAALEAISLQQKVSDSTAKLEETYPQLQGGLLQIARIKYQTNRSFTLGPGEGAVRRIVITAEPNDDFPEILRLHEGESEVFSKPKVGWRCELSIGMAWSEPVATYGSRDSVLVNLTTEDYRMAPHIMLTVAPASITFMSLSAGLGLGKSNAPDFYLGGTIRLLNPVMINFGAVWQRIPELPKGFQQGMFLQDPNDAQVLNLLEDPALKYRPRMFFGIGISR